MSVIFFLLSLLFVKIAARVQLSDGTSMQRGTISTSLAWQSSGIYLNIFPGVSSCLIVLGILYQGCEPPMKIANCYSLFLTSDPQKQLDPGYPTPRQRIEFRSPNQADGTTFKYTWKHYLDRGVGTTQHFFHLMQVFSTGDGGPVVTLDALSGKATIVDFFRSCVDTRCPSIDIAALEGRVTSHSMIVRYGPHGKLNYNVSDALTGTTLLSYNIIGTMGTGGS